MRDGRWKLVRPAIRELMQVSNEDLAMDIQSKYNPENFHDISHPEPARIKPNSATSSTLRYRQRPLRAQRSRRKRPARVSKMTTALASSFEDVEHDRLSIPAV